MTPEELLLLNQEAKKAEQSLLSFLMNGISQRHPLDKVLRCIRCGVCMPSKKDRSIYSEFCDYCKTKLETPCE